MVVIYQSPLVAMSSLGWVVRQRRTVSYYLFHLDMLMLYNPLLAKFYVRATNEGSLLLQTVTDSRKYLSISDDHLNCDVSNRSYT